MKRNVPLWVAAAVAAASLVLGVVGAGTLAWRLTKDLVLTRELEVAGLCAGGLRLSSEGSEERAPAASVEGRMDTAVRESARLVEGGARLHGPASALVESARRVAAHYEAAANESMREKADRVVLALIAAREGEEATSGGR
jgi:hypothetical protein